MATEHTGLVALAVAAPSIVATSAATSFQIATGDYALATIFSLIGIVGRHCYEASRMDPFDLKVVMRRLAFDAPTAPMLGIVAWAGCLYFNIEPLIVPPAVVLLSFLGPEWLRSFGSGLVDVVLGRLRNGSKP